VEAKRRQLVADIADRRYVKIEGISTIGGGVRMNNSEMCVLDGLDMHYISHYIDGGDQREGFIDRPRNNTDQNGAPPRGEMGIYVGGTDNIIVNNIIDHSAASGIYATGLYTYIENNALNDCGYMGSYISGINLFTEAWNSPNHPRGGYAIFNNTVYNCGRSTFNVSRSQQAGYGLVPFIPYEVAFNDFHDGILTSLDTGLTYEYYTLQGHDKLKSSMHHNLVYYTVAPEEKNAFCMGIYHDGGTQGIDTYNNVVFTTQQDTVFTYGEVFVQPLPAAVANHDVWNNSTLHVVEGGVAALKEEHYPNGQPFYAGARLEGEKYLVNYERVTENKNNGSFLWAKDAELSDGIVIDEYGYAAFSGNGQYIRFKDVDFGEASNVLSLMFAGDKYNTLDEIEIVVGSLASGKKYTKKLNVTSPYFNCNNLNKIPIDMTSGLSDVYICMASYKSVRFLGILQDAYNIDNMLAAKVYGGTFSNAYNNSIGDPTAYFVGTGDPVNPMVNNTWPDNLLEYQKITLLGDSNILVIAAGSAGTSAGQPIEVRLGSKTGEVLAKYYVNKNSFTDYTPKEVPLSRTLSAGTYDFWLTFPREKGRYLSSNIYYFAFKKMDGN
ncbi:MAG: carbohydrate-binding protein, partial [Dehalococcoidales bacterium]